METEISPPSPIAELKPTNHLPGDRTLHSLWKRHGYGLRHSGLRKAERNGLVLFPRETIELDFTWFIPSGGTWSISSLLGKKQKCMHLLF